MLQVTIRSIDRAGSAVTAVITGKLDAASADAFVQAMLPAVTPRCTLVLDMAGVSDVTHAGMLALFRVALIASGLIGDDAADNQAALNRLLRADYRGIAPLHLVAPRWHVRAQIQTSGLGAIAVVHEYQEDQKGTPQRSVPYLQYAA